MCLDDADPEHVLYLDERHWLKQADLREDRRYLYAMPATGNSTDLRHILEVSQCLLFLS